MTKLDQEMSDMSVDDLLDSTLVVYNDEVNTFAWGRKMSYGIFTSYIRTSSTMCCSRS